MKWSGASICVPVCESSDIAEVLQTSPWFISRSGSIRTGGLWGQLTIPVRSGTETSIERGGVYTAMPSFLQRVVPPRRAHRHHLRVG